MEKQKKQKENNVIDTFQKGKMDTSWINSNGKNSIMEMEANHVLSIKEAFRLATLGGSEGQCQLNRQTFHSTMKNDTACAHVQQLDFIF